MHKILEELLNPVLAKFSTAKLSSLNEKELLLTINSNEIYSFMEILKNQHDLLFDHVSLITAVDLLEKFEIVYKIYSYQNKFGLEIKTDTSRENPSVPSVTPLWSSANWQEREVYDLYGISFEGHPDLRRIFVAEDFPGYPFRKDWPCENNEQFILRESNTIPK